MVVGADPCIALWLSRAVEGTLEGHADTERHTALITLRRHFVQLFFLTRAFPVWSQDGKTALDYAKKEKHKSVVALLYYAINRALVSV